ncbi:MAG: hypothetical protein GY953_48860 [bacterium]|nr:hypothetical protein [bacterium]
MNRTEQALFEHLQDRLPESEINAAADVVREVRQIFESEDWRRLIAR